MRVLALLVVGAILEIAVLIAVGQAIGLISTLVLLVLGTLVGVSLVAREGSRTRAAISEALRTRRAPHQELADGVLVVVAGVLILLPGFVSDAAGLFLLFPPTRRLVSRRLADRAERQVALFEHQQRFGSTTGVVDGEVIMVDDAGARITPRHDEALRRSG